MGRQLVAQAFLLYSNRFRDEHVPFRVLLFMANTAKDGDDQPTFYMGNRAIAELALGRPEPSKADVNAVQRALQRLRAVGAVTTIGRPAPGRRMATYRLHLDAPASMERTPVTDVRSAADPASTYPAERGMTYPAERGIHVPRSAGYKAQEVDIGGGKTGGQRSTPAPRETTRVPPAARDAFAANGLKVGPLRSIDGGRSDGTHDAVPVQLPLLAAVPDLPPEPVAPQRIEAQAQ